MSEFPVTNFVKQRPFIPAINPANNTNYQHFSMITPAASTDILIPQGIAGMLIQALDENVRITFTGTAPTATTGFRLTAGDPPVWIDTPNGLTIHAIGEAGGGNGTIEYEYGA